MTEEPTRPHPFSRTEAHPFEEPSGGGDACAFCGEPRTDILHHPTRIRAACLLHGLDPSALLTTRRRRSRS